VILLQENARKEATRYEDLTEGVMDAEGRGKCGESKSPDVERQKNSVEVGNLPDGRLVRAV
jgi:hypothetical protein